MEKLGLDDIELMSKMAIEGEKIIDEIREDLEANPCISKGLGAMFNDASMTLFMALLLVYATMDTDVRRRLDGVAEIYREA